MMVVYHFDRQQLFVYTRLIYTLFFHSIVGLIFSKQNKEKKKVISAAAIVFVR